MDIHYDPPSQIALEYAVLKQVLGTAIRFYVDESLYAARRWRAGVPDPRGCLPG